MYLCLCNGLTSVEVERIVDDVCQSVAGVYPPSGLPAELREMRL